MWTLQWTPAHSNTTSESLKRRFVPPCCNPSPPRTPPRTPPLPEHVDCDAWNPRAYFPPCKILTRTGAGKPLPVRYRRIYTACISQRMCVEDELELTVHLPGASFVCITPSSLWATQCISHQSSMALPHHWANIHVLDVLTIRPSDSCNEGKSQEWQTNATSQLRGERNRGRG